LSGPDAPSPEDGATTPLGARLAARIARHGPITLADYMAEALTHPRHGYYMHGDPFGTRGDFITAPEISQIFGELIGLWCAEVWHAQGAPDPVLLVELGPGRGTLMADALRAARIALDFHRAVRPHLVEISPALRRRQAETLHAYSGDLTPTWHDSLADVPEGPILLIANEFFDALPVRQFARTAAGWCERLVTLSADGRSLILTLGPPGPQAEILTAQAKLNTPPGAIAEVSPAAIGIAAEIGRRLAAHGGAALIIDYGNDRPPGEPTLQAVRRHARHDVLAQPGRADLTAHVDFAALARAATEAGARASGPVPQGAFLEALGLSARVSTLSRTTTPAQAEAIAAAVHRLTDTAEMGTLFKALALSAPGNAALPGFPQPA
jgi:NADH dehydrogenase [ubiquinone] 1 alpha subcomplex assembly factor 7